MHPRFGCGATIGQCQAPVTAVNGFAQCGVYAALRGHAANKKMVNAIGFQQVIKDANEHMAKLSIGVGIVDKTLPKPEDLKNSDLRAEIFDRLAVAYGLSFDSFDIGHIVPPAEINDVPPRRPTDWQGRFVSKEQV